VKPPVIILLGPTGVGKTSVSIELALILGTEIISADSMQIYRHMDIGTGKPSEEQLNKVPHHMIDIVEPSEDFSAGMFVDMVIPIIERLHRDGKVPIITGGTGLYIKTITRGLFKGPPADWALREELLKMEEKDHGSLYEYLKRVDPEAASSINPSDIRRTLRALEVSLLGGMRFSQAKERLTKPLPYEFIKIGLTRKREELYEIVNKRVDEMLSKGLLKEAESVLEMNPSRTALQAIGYKELFSYLRGECSLKEAVSLIKRNTRRYAKRQFTWFNSEESVQWVDITGLFEPKKILKKIIDESDLNDIIIRYGKRRQTTLP